MFQAELGAGILLAALVLCVVSILISFSAGHREDALLAPIGRRAFCAMAVMIVAAALVLEWALVGHDFEIAYVTEHTDRSLPLALTMAALYGGQEGSLLYWVLGVAVIGSVSMAAAARLGVKLTAYATGFLALVCLFYLIMLVFVASPFSLLATVPPDGLGLNPVLRDGGMLIHPPFMLAGFSFFAIPFSFAMAALLAGRNDVAWIAHTRRVALLGWGLQGVGLTLGMWWAYHVLGWGGYWGWDPVENVALMPWLVTTAYIHSAQIQERRGQLRAWTIFLVIVAFLLSIFGTYIVRSGIVTSVHSFAVSPLGPWFYGFLIVCVVTSAVLLAWRARSLGSPPLESAVSREGAFVAQNVIVMGITAAIFWGTVLPLVSGMFGTPLVVGPSYYERVGAPLFVLLLALLAVGPLLPWRRAGRVWLRALRWPLLAAALSLALLVLFGARSPGALVVLPLLAAALTTSALELVRGGRAVQRAPGPWAGAAVRAARRNRRRYGASLAHIGIVVAIAGIAASHFWQTQTQVTLRPGQGFTVAGYHLAYQGLSSQVVGDHSVKTAHLTLGDEQLGPALASYPGLGAQALPRVAIRSTPIADLYLVLVSSRGQSVTITAFVNPLVTWIWAGVGLMILGVIFGNLGGAGPEPVAEPRALRRPAVARS